MMQNKEAYNSVIRARTSLILKHPFFASLALRLTVQEDESCHTAWTDGEVFAYNPDYISILSQDKLEGLAAHVVMHPACNHHKRRQMRDPKLWNRACDYAINWILLDAGLILPDGHLYLEEYRNRSAESVYEILYRENGGDDSEGEASEEDGQNSEEEEQDEQKENKEEVTGEQGDDGEETPPSLNDPGLSGEIRDVRDGALGKDDSSNETDWDEALVQAAHNAREIGKLPAGLARLLDNTINPKLNWQELLARFIERSARSDYSWLTPNRRYIHQNIYFPSLSNSELSQIVIGIDTSGSITSYELNRFAAEISGIMEQYPASIHLIYCDTKVQDYQLFERSDLPVTINPKGGGGTDYRPVFELIGHEALDPACLIYLTDMECINFPTSEPDYPVLWVKSGTSPRRPPFGEVLLMEKNSEN
jgi:predicted metal-dependent peptidase